MAFFNKYPYSDFHELNLDWIIHAISQLHKDWDEFKVINTITAGGTWDITKQYKAWTIVEDNNNGYISAKPVPAGVLITNTDYWKPTADYSTIIAGLADRVDALETTVGDSTDGLVKDVSDNSDAIDTINDAIDTINDTIGDASSGIVKDVNDLKSENDLKIYGAIKPTTSGWQVISDANHTPLNIDSVEIDGSDNLVVHHTPGANTVGSLIVAPDESFASVGLSVGASVGINSSIVNMSCNPLIGGYIAGSGTAATIVSGFSQNLNSCVWSNNHFKIYPSATLLKLLGGPIGANITKNYDSVYDYRMTIASDHIQVFCYANGESTAIVTPTNDVKFAIQILMNPVVSPTKLVTNAEDLSSFNLWLYGQMK